MSSYIISYFFLSLFHYLLSSLPMLSPIFTSLPPKCCSNVLWGLPGPPSPRVQMYHIHIYFSVSRDLVAAPQTPITPLTCSSCPRLMRLFNLKTTPSSCLLRNLLHSLYLYHIFNFLSSPVSFSHHINIFKTLLKKQ